MVEVKKAATILVSVGILAVSGMVCLLLYDLHLQMPLVHDALWNLSSSSWDVKQHSQVELETTQKVLADAKGLIGRVDCNLNGCRRGALGLPAVPGLIPQLTVVAQKSQPILENLNQTVLKVNGSIERIDTLLASTTASTDELKLAIGTFRQSVADLDVLITDPKIHTTIDNLAATTGDLDVSVRQLDAMLKSGTATAEDVQAVADKVREQYTKAKNLYYAIFKELLSVGSQGIQFVLKK